MNTASQDIPRHLSALRERMKEPQKYELAATYFLEEFAGDLDFLAMSEPDAAPHVVQVISHLAQETLGHHAELKETRVFKLTQYKFYHGCAAVDDRALLFFYFEEDQTGVFLVFPGCRGSMDVGRFQVPSPLADPRTN